MANTIEQGIQLTADKMEQIVSYDISGAMGDDRDQYYITFRSKIFNKFPDGTFTIESDNKYRFKIADKLVDADGNVIQSRVDLMNDFVTLMYELLEEEKNA
jgi:hypothetical protein